MEVELTGIINFIKTGITSCCPEENPDTMCINCTNTRSIINNLWVYGEYQAKDLLKE